MNRLSKSFDINKKLWLEYDQKGRKFSKDIITELLWIELWIALLFKNVVLASQRTTRLKSFNVLYKALDECKPSWFVGTSELGLACELLWKEILNEEKPGETPLFDNICMDDISSNSSKKTFKILPLTVLFYEGPIARVYLETMYSLGYQPEKIIELIPAKNVLTKKSLGKWLPYNMRKTYARSVFTNQMHYWSNYLKKKEPEFIENVMKEIEEKWQISSDTMNRAHARYPLSIYTNSIESLLIDNLQDPVLYNFLSSYALNVKKCTILFTGGGIVPASLLELPNLSFLHLHPGYLPYIRGADGALWSLLLSGHFSATSFYMSSGIDTGDIILPCWLPKMSIPAFTQIIELKMQYRAFYGFIDPWIRAYVLRRMIFLAEHSHKDWAELLVQTQVEEIGETYYFMHKNLQEAALSVLKN